MLINKKVSSLSEYDLMEEILQIFFKSTKLMILPKFTVDCQNLSSIQIELNIFANWGKLTLQFFKALGSP